MLFILELSAVAVCAITGALEAGRRKMDLFGASVIAFAAALGGGTLRDILLGRLPVFWVLEPVYLYVAALTVIGTHLVTRRVQISTRAFLLPDALGLALFTVIGTQMSLEFRPSVPIAIVMGVVTGVFGGIVRDVLCNEVPVVFRGELYATAALSGAVLFAILGKAGVPTPYLLPLAAAATFGIRTAALRWKIGLPKIAPPC
jgi:uncharacterized membrane protein YeiH